MHVAFSGGFFFHASPLAAMFFSSFLCRNFFWELSPHLRLFLIVCSYKKRFVSVKLKWVCLRHLILSSRKVDSRSVLVEHLVMSLIVWKTERSQFHFHYKFVALPRATFKRFLFTSRVKLLERTWNFCWYLCINSCLTGIMALKYEFVT